MTRDDALPDALKELGGEGARLILLLSQSLQPAEDGLGIVAAQVLNRLERLHEAQQVLNDLMAIVQRRRAGLLRKGLDAGMTLTVMGAAAGMSRQGAKKAMEAVPEDQHL